MGKQKERQEPQPNFLGRWAYTRYLYLSEDFIPMALIPRLTHAVLSMASHWPSSLLSRRRWALPSRVTLFRASVFLSPSSLHAP